MDRIESQFSNIDLETIIDLSYLETSDGILYQCITTSTRFLLYRDNTLIDVHYFENDLISEYGIKTHVYSMQNCIVFIKNDLFETWRVKDNALCLSNKQHFEHSNSLKYTFQDIIDTDNKNIRSACLAGYSSNIIRLWQICFDYQNEEAFIVFQQSMCVEDVIDDVCMFPVDTASLDFSACAIRTKQIIKLITISMTYISNADRYLGESEIVKKVSNMKLQYTVDGGDPLTFKSLDKFDSNRLRNKKTLILSYREAIMGSYYLNLNLLYSGELPRHIDDLKITNSFSKYKNTHPLSKDLQALFLDFNENKNSQNAECCLVQHANSMVSIMFYNSNLINAKDPCFINLTYVKDIKSLKFFKKSNLLLYVGNKVRSGTINDMAKVFKKGNRLKSSLKYSDDDKRKNFKVKTYANIDDLALLIKILPFECSSIYNFENKLNMESDYKKMKILNDKDTKQSDQYLFSINNNFKNDSVLTNILRGNKYDLVNKGFKFIDSMQGFLYLETTKGDHRCVMNLKLLTYEDNAWVSKEIVSKFNKSFNVKFYDMNKVSIKFMSNIYDSSEVTGLLTYVEKAGVINCFHFAISDENEVRVTYQIDLSHSISNLVDNDDFCIQTKKENSMIYSKIQAIGNEDAFQNTEVVILEPFFFNADIDIFWIVSDSNVQVILIDKIEAQELKFWSYQKDADIFKAEWIRESNWCISSDGSKCILSINNKLKMFEIPDDYFIDFNIENKLLMGTTEADSIDDKFIKLIDLDYRTTVICQFYIEHKQLMVRGRSMETKIASCILTPVGDNSTMSKENDHIFSVITVKDDDNNISMEHSFKVMVGYKNLASKVGKIKEYKLKIEL